MGFQDFYGNSEAVALVRGMLALAQLNSTRNPDAVAILQTLQIQAQGNTLKLSLTVPEDQLERLIRFGRPAGVRKVAAQR